MTNHGVLKEVLHFRSNPDNSIASGAKEFGRSLSAEAPSVAIAVYNPVFC